MFVAVGHDGLRLASDGRARPGRPRRPARRARSTAPSPSATASFAAVGSYGGKNIMARHERRRGLDDRRRTTRSIPGITAGSASATAGSSPSAATRAAVGVASAFVSTSTDGDDLERVPGHRRQVHAPPRGVRQRPLRRRRRPRPTRPVARRPALGRRARRQAARHADRRRLRQRRLRRRRPARPAEVDPRRRDWSEPVRGREGEHLNSVVWADDRFVAVAPGATFTSPDGLDLGAARRTPTPR